MDVVFWRSRGGELTEVVEADEFILDGEYFEAHPHHILGEEGGSFAGDDEAGLARSWRYKVTGDFRGLPPLTPRPVCTACVLTSIVPREDVGTFKTVVREDDAIPADIDEELRPALELGRRGGRYLAAIGADDADRTAQLWPELYAALGDFTAHVGNPWRSKPLRELAEGPRALVAAQQLLNVFEKSGDLIAPLREAPAITPKFSGQPEDIVAQAEALFRQQRALTIAQLMRFHEQQGGSLTPEAALGTLVAAGWNLDGDGWDQLLPSDAYLSGNDLWARYDRAVARGDQQAKVQARRLLDAIKPAVFDDLTDISPQHGYVPLELVAGWISATLKRGIEVAGLREVAVVVNQGGVAVEAQRRVGRLWATAVLEDPRDAEGAGEAAVGAVPCDGLAGEGREHLADDVAVVIGSVRERPRPCVGRRREHRCPVDAGRLDLDEGADPLLIDVAAVASPRQEGSALGRDLIPFE